MGPLATAHFYRLLVESTRAGRDQDHVPVIMWADPRVPDRTAAILGHGPCPTPALRNGLHWLEASGAQFVAIPCNTAHAYLTELRASTDLEILDMVSEAVSQCQALNPRVRRIGVLCTRGTRAAMLYELAAEQQGLEICQVAPDMQDLVDGAISQVKAGMDLRVARASIRSATMSLRLAGAELVVAACTEIPLVNGEAAEVLPFVDSTSALVSAVLDRSVAPSG